MNDLNNYNTYSGAFDPEIHPQGAFNPNAYPQQRHFETGQSGNSSGINVPAANHYHNYNYNHNYNDHHNHQQHQQPTGVGASPIYYDSQSDLSHYFRPKSNPEPVRKELTGRGKCTPHRPLCPCTQLFVSNISYRVNWIQLEEHFRQCGDVERVEVFKGKNGKKKGYGIVRYHSAVDAWNALQRLNDVELGGRHLQVKMDEKAERRMQSQPATTA